MLTVSRTRHRTRWPVAVLATVLVTVLATLLAAVLVATAPAAAQAAPNCDEGADDRFEFWHAFCTESPRFAGTGGGGEAECVLDPDLWGIPVECFHEFYGWWSVNWQCYVRFSTPQPPASDPVWAGHTPADGAIYRATCPWLEGLDGLPWTAFSIQRFIASGSGPIGSVLADAIGRLVITGPDIHMAPDPDGVGLVGLPVWIWTPVTEQTWSPDPVRVPVLNWVLVVEAAVDRIVYDLGNGDSVVCDRGPGTPYQDHFGAQESPDCGYRGYSRPSSLRPDGLYHITATTHWLISWRFETAAGAATGLAGEETTTRLSTTSVRINELQVVTS
jgi:hypothetical protein